MNSFNEKKQKQKSIFHVVLFPVVVSLSTSLLNPQEGILRICRFFSAVAVKLNPSCPPGLFYCGLRWKRDGKPAGKLYLLRRLEKYFPLCVYFFMRACADRGVNCNASLNLRLQLSLKNTATYVVVSLLAHPARQQIYTCPCL